MSDWGFLYQITRSGLSIPSNIADGYERVSPFEIARFLTIAKGSAGEPVSQIYIGREAGYTEEDDVIELPAEVKELSRMPDELI